jgi:hypothetical protein
MSEAFQFPWDTDPAPSVTTPASEPAAEPRETKQKRRGRRPASVTRTAMLTRNSAPDWLYHHLTISRTAEPVALRTTERRGLTSQRIGGGVASLPRQALGIAGFPFYGTPQSEIWLRERIAAQESYGCLLPTFWGAGRSDSLHSLSEVQPRGFCSGVRCAMTVTPSLGRKILP